MPIRCISAPSEKEWDSRFFGFPVGVVTLPCGVRGPELREHMKAWPRQVFRLIYVFTAEPGDEDIRKVLENAGALAFGTRVTYRKTYETSVAGETARSPVATRKNPQLEGLAHVSGTCSRFSRDARLRPFFRRLYGTWLEKELSEGKVFVFPDPDRPVGMATVTLPDEVKLGERIGNIGLVAVDAQYRGRGIAINLMADVETWLRYRGATGCEVVTQGENSAARSLYERLGFQNVSEVGVWHMWMPSQKEEAS